MLQLDLISKLMPGSPGPAKSTGFQMGLHHVDALDRLVSERSNTRDFWKKIMGNSHFIFEIFAWPDNVLVLSMIEPEHDRVFPKLSDTKRDVIRKSILQMDADLRTQEFAMCSEQEYSSYRKTFGETIENCL